MSEKRCYTVKELQGILACIRSSVYELLKRNIHFIDLFEQDRYRLQLFSYSASWNDGYLFRDIRTITLKQVITNYQYNDLAFLVRDRLMVFVEAQSTWSVNILIRILLYLADTIQEIPA